jgi:kynureninase
MEPVFDPARELKAGKSVIYQYSLAPYLASVEMFDEIGMDAIIEKRDKITCYLEYILEEISKEIEGSFEIITPTNPDERDAIIRFTSWARSKLV